jgi:hypothetical protein
MSIIQISKILQRSGDLVDLPQLDQAELGFASDASRLFIGKTTGIPENVEILTAYSNISFSQIDGGYGNLNISANVLDGELLVYDGNNWVNRGGDAGGLIDLGNAANVKLGGGGIGFVLTTDGTGNLSWSPKAIVTYDIADITSATPGVVSFNEEIYLVNGAEVTITNVQGMTGINGQSYFIGNLTANTFALYSDITLETPVNTTSLGTYTSGGKITSAVGGSEGSANAAGVTTSVQFNTNNLLDASANFTFNKGSNTLTVTNANVTGNFIANNASFSNITLGGPFTTTAITTGANTTAGTITGNWTLTTGSKLQATYADLAEYYAADKNYTPGTVLQFGGDKEVTIAKEETSKIAGVVSSDPAYVMNGDIRAEHPVIVALIGRVKVKVIGSVLKGDMMVSAGNGFAKASIIDPKIGTVIGKAIENKFDGDEGMIEVMVGRS